MPKLDAEKIEHLMTNALIPPQPLVLKKINDEYQKKDPDIRLVGRYVASDVMLSASFYKVINTPKFLESLSSQPPLYSIEDLIGYLGPEKTKRIVDRVALIATMEGAHDKDLLRFWDSAADVALISETIAKQLDIEYHHEAYLLGLFRDVGLPIMMKVIPGYYDFIVDYNRSRSATPLPELENEYFNLNHQTLGYCVTRAWNFPILVSRAILMHHYPSLVSKGNIGTLFEKINVLISILVIAEQIDDQFRALNRGRDMFDTWQPVSDVVLYNLSINHTELEQIRDNILESLDGLLLSRDR